MMLKKFFKSFLGFAEQLLITLFVTALAFTYIFRVVSVVGDSMCNTLKDGDRIIISMLDKKCESGDIVVVTPRNAVVSDGKGGLEYKEGLKKSVVKRVIAVAGQTVDIDFSAGIVTVDGKRIYEEYTQLGLTHYDGGAFTGEYPVTVPDGYIFVMGDNRSVSLDSRSDKIGFVAVEDIMGTAIMKIYPEMEFCS